MPDTKPLSDNQVDDKLKAAIAVLGEAPGATVRGDTAISAARKMLSLLSMGLITAKERSDARNDPG